MRQFGWWLRLALLSAAFVGLGVYLVSRLHRVPDYSGIMAQGDQLVAAIEEFKAQRGLWPEYLDDVGPYLPQRRRFAGKWFYQVEPVVDGSGRRRQLPSLSVQQLEGEQKVHVGYDFDPDRPAWRVFGGGEDRILRITAAQAHPAAGTQAGAVSQPSLAGDDGLARQLAELDRRIVREPWEIEHWRGKAAVLVGRNRYKEAANVARAAQNALPESYWPRMAQAALAIRTPEAAASTSPAASRTGGEESLGDFAQWAHDHPTFTRLYYLSVLYRMSGQDDLAAGAMSDSLQQPVEIEADDPNTAAYYFWDMTRWALATERWPLAIATCGAWEAASKAGLVAEPSFYALRAAAELATGNLAAARTDLAALDKDSYPKPLWVRHIEGPSGLREAITRGDRTYRYPPLFSGETPGPFEIFPLPQ